MVAFANLVGDGFAHCSGFPSSSVIVTYDSMLASLGPVAWWKLADIAGTTSPVDSSGNGWTGTVNGSSVTFGVPGPIPGDTGATFSGTGYISASGPFPPFQNHDHTVIVWATKVGATERLLFMVGSPSSGLSEQFIYDNGAEPGLAASINGEATVGNFSPGSGWSTWTMFALTFTQATGVLRFFVNGVNTATSTTGLTLNATVNMLLGSYTSGGFTWDGNIAQAAIFNSVLTPTQISALYALA